MWLVTPPCNSFISGFTVSCDLRKALWIALLLKGATGIIKRHPAVAQQGSSYPNSFSNPARRGEFNGKPPPATSQRFVCSKLGWQGAAECLEVHFYPAELVKQREWWEKICEVTATAATGWKRCFLMKMSDIARCGALCSVFSEEEKWATAEGFRFTSGSNYRSKSRSLEWIHNREVRLQGISGFELEGYYRNPDAPHVSCMVKDLAT